MPKRRSRLNHGLGLVVAIALVLSSTIQHNSLMASLLGIGGGSNSGSSGGLGGLLNDTVDEVENLLDDPLGDLGGLDDVLEDTVDTVEDTVDGLFDEGLEEVIGEPLDLVEDLNLPPENLEPISIGAELLSGDENSVNVEITLLSEPQLFDVSVDYIIRGDTADLASDFLPLIGTAVIEAGETQTVIPLTLVNDLLDEDLENLIIEIYDPVNALLGDNVLEFEISDDDDAAILLDPICVSAQEGQGSGTYYLSLNSIPEHPVTINLVPNNSVEVSPETLTITPENWNQPHPINLNGLDGGLINTTNVLFLAESLDVNFLGQELINLGDIVITDYLPGADEETGGLVNILNCDSEGGLLSGLPGLDDLLYPEPGDDLAVIDLEYDVFCGSENSNGGAHATVQLLEAKPFDVAVGYMISGGTALLGQDLIPKSGVVVIEAGETEVEIPINNLIDDDLIEPAESVVIELFEPINAILGQGARLECQIRDDDHVGISLNPFCISANQGQNDPLYYLSLTTKPTDTVEVDLVPSNSVNLDPFSLTFTPENWYTPQVVSVSDVTNLLTLGALGGQNEGGTLHTSDMLLSFNSLDLRFNEKDPILLPAEIFYDDSDFENEGGLLNVAGCSHGTCAPSDPNCNPACDPAVSNCGGGPGGGGGGGGGSNGPGGGAFGAAGPSTSIKSLTLKRSYCLDFVEDRPLEFVDIDDAGDLYKPFLLALKNTKENEAGQFALSGYNTQTGVDVDDIRVTPDAEKTFVGPQDQLVRLAQVKTLLISHCYPILDATKMTETFDGRPMKEWDDLPRIHTGDPNHDFAVDVAYSGYYWGIWEGDRGANTIRINDPVTNNEMVKMLLRIQEQVEHGAPLTFDDPSEQWWLTYYNESEKSGLAQEARGLEPGLPAVRQVSVKELVLALLQKNLYTKSAQEAVLEFIRKQAAEMVMPAGL